MSNKPKIVLWCAGLLLIINLALLTFIFTNGKNRPRPEGPKKLIIERLHFDNFQVDEYDELITWHRSQLDKTNNEMLFLKRELYGHIGKSDSLSEDSIIVLIATKQMEMERINVKHFMDIKNMCRPDQMQYFDALSSEIADLFQPHKSRP